MGDNLIDFADSEPASEVQSNPPEIPDYPQTLVTEKIIFCIDILLLSNNVGEESFIQTCFSLLSSYFNLKKKICVKPPEFECLLVVNNDKIVHSCINSVKDLRATFAGIGNFCCQEDDEPLEADKVFKKIADIVELPDPVCHEKCVPPPWVYHVIWLFGRNMYIPTMENTNPFDYLMMTPYFALDILYIYDNTSENNYCEQISKALLGLNENGKGYFLSVKFNQKEKIFSNFAQLLGHPLIRSPQAKAKFNITELGPQVGIVKEEITEDETKSSSNDFIREYELENDQGSIFVTQKEIGDVHCVVWDAALVLAKYLEKMCLKNKGFLSGKKVVELGSGLGCVGLVAAFYGADVTVTDLPNALPQLELNLQKNEKLVQSQQGSAKAVALDWNEDVNFDPFDFILLADCVYYQESVPGLVKTMNQLSSTTTRIFLTQENRSYSKTQTEIWRSFITEVTKLFKIHVVPSREQHEEFRSSDIYLLELTKL